MEETLKTNIFLKINVFCKISINAETHEMNPTIIIIRGRKTQDARMHCIPESFCASGKFLRVYTKLTLKSSQLSGKFPDSLESFRTVWKVSGQSGKCPDSLESFRTVWKVSGQFGKIPDSLESFRTVWKNSGQSGKFPDSLEKFRTVWNVSRESGKFPDDLESESESQKALKSEEFSSVIAMASSGKHTATLGSRTGESKREVECGLCRPSKPDETI